MPQQTEPSANNALGLLLQPMLPRNQVITENTRILVGHPGLQPDIVITASGRSPVVVEAEFMPAFTAEAEAKARLGLEVANTGRTIESVIALRYPESVRNAGVLAEAIANSELSFCVWSENGARFPESGWLYGGVEDLADLIRLVSVPQKAVDEAASALEAGINNAAYLLDQVNETRQAITISIARLLGMTNVPQTRRMACAIIANALVFHERIAGMHQNVKPLALVCGDSVPNPQNEVLAAWTAILDINYWAIFAIARDILQQLPSGDAAQILRRLRDTAQAVNATGVDNAHDLTGRIFQRLIADRKYLATFYTLPASAALLACLAVAKLEGVDWSDPAAIGNLRVADFACGTGALVSAVYDQIAARHERTGGDPARLHRAMMEEVLYGCDVMPSAIHITGSTLSGVEPEIGFASSRLYTMPYGRQSDGTVKIGSLELLQTSTALTLFNTSDPAQRTGSAGEETAAQINAEIPDEGFDLIIMNPPFTSNTKHHDAADGVLNAAFAAFDSDTNEQGEMAKRLGQLAIDGAYHGHAGMASAFVALAEKKLRPHGVIALVLPFTAINGASWAKFRELITNQYKDAIIVSIAAADNDALSFSSDTGMAECLVVAHKKTRDDKPNKRARFVSLTSRPDGFISAAEVARAILTISDLRRVEDGPYGGASIYCGDAPAGEMLDAPTGEYSSGWGAARIADYAVAQVAHSLSASKLWLPGQRNALDLAITPMSNVGQRGLDSQMFISPAHKGPFTKAPPSPTATYPSLWNHDAQNETRILCVPDSQLQARHGMEDKAADVWATASRAHISRGFRFNSQSLAVAFTEQESIGGRGWPNVAFTDVRLNYPFALWCNSTLGLLSYWWHSSRQQGGRGDMTILSAETLPVLDFRTLTDAQLATAQAIFEEFRDKDLQPAYLADADPNRALLDRRVICGLLGFDESVYQDVRRLAAKWCAEPSVHGGKPRPPGSTLAV